MAVSIKSSREIELMRESCRLLAIVHEEMGKIIRPGISTGEIDAYGEKLIRDFGCTPNFKNYNGYLAVNYCGATGYNVEVLSLVLETQEYNNFVYVAEIKETEEIFVENRTIKVLFYLEDGEYIISSISNENKTQNTEN
mgnify:CR=1 FL=1